MIPERVASRVAGASGPGGAKERFSCGANTPLPREPGDETAAAAAAAATTAAVAAADGDTPAEIKRPISPYHGASAPIPDTLPKVTCLVRARIPTVHGSEIFLHLYHNDMDTKEHLAIVFGNSIRSRSLDAVRPGETELDRMTRGAYTGRLYPGRQSSYSTPNDPPATPTSSTSSAALTTALATPGTIPIESHTFDPEKGPLVRIHSECYTGETAWSARCDCGEQLDEAARLMDEAGEGVIVYLRQEGRGIGLGEKLKAYNLQDLGSDTVEANLLLQHPADGRTYGLATAILLDLSLDRIQLLTNNPDKVRAAEGPKHEVRVTKRVGMVPRSWRGEEGVKGEEVGRYLRTKMEKMGHMIS